MSTRRVKAWISGCVCIASLACAAAPLTEAEKQLLLQGISATAATDFGKAADAAGLERIVALGDPALVQSFGYGMQVARIEQLPPAIEAIVVKRFDDAKVGAALRALQPRYQTRGLFDLHYARIQAAFRSDEPSFEQILRTDQPGIEEPLLKIAAKFPARPNQPNPVALFAARRKHPDAVPLMLAELEGAFKDSNAARMNYNTVLDLLAAYPSLAVWRKAGAEIDRLRAEGRLTEAAHAAAHRRLDPLLADPDAEIARVKRREVADAWQKKRESIMPLAAQITPLRETAPRRYVEEYTAYIERLEAAGQEFPGEDVDYEIAAQYTNLGVFARFRLRDAPLAARLLEKAAKGRSLVGQVVLADTYQLELRDKTKALRAYELALATASEPKGARLITPYARPGDAMNEFWKAWLAAEIAFLRTGKPFNGRVAEAAIGGFWEAIGVWARVATLTFPEWSGPYLQAGYASARGFGGVQGFGVAQPLAPGAETINKSATIDKAEAKALASRLSQVPASRFALLVTLRYISTLPDAGAILAELARNDPSGYWTTIVLGTVSFHEARGDAGREAARGNGVADALPGMEAPGRPNALASAARRHLQARELRVVAAK
jgi:hypothetical protein